VGRRDITAFTNRLSYLRHNGVISAHRTVVVSRCVRSNLARMRSLGLTRPGEPLHGLPDDFALLAEDIPDDPEDTEAGKDLPGEVMRQICEHLPSLGDTKRNGNENRVAAELLIDTGRRPMEVCQLRWDCLQQDASGQNVLISRQLQGWPQRTPPADLPGHRRSDHQAAGADPRRLPPDTLH
jgi:integrase